MLVAEDESRHAVAPSFALGICGGRCAVTFGLEPVQHDLFPKLVLTHQSALLIAA